MTAKYLLQTQANDVYLELSAGGWDTSEFAWEEVVSPEHAKLKGLVNKLVHQPSGYHFLFDNFGGIFSASFSPGAEKRIEYAGRVGGWEEQFELFKNWLKFLFREVHAPNLWEDLPNPKQLIEAAARDENSEFTNHEIRQIRGGIKELKEFIEHAYKPDAERLESHLKYLVESSGRLGRKDWANVLVGMLFQFVVSGIVPQTAAQELFQFAWTIFKSVLTTPILLPM